MMSEGSKATKKEDPLWWIWLSNIYGEEDNIDEYNDDDSVIFLFKYSSILIILQYTTNNYSDAWHDIPKLFFVFILFQKWT